MKTEEEYFAEIEAGRMTPREAWAQMNVDGWVEDGWSQELQALMLPHILNMWDRDQEMILGSGEPHFTGVLDGN